MNKTRYISILAALLVLVVAFTGCEVTLDLKPQSTEAGNSLTVTNENGENIPVVTIIEVTDEQGEVVETQPVTLSSSDVNDAKDFFSNNNKGETSSSHEAADRVTKPAVEEEPIVTKPSSKPSNKPSKNDDENEEPETTSVSKEPEYEFRGDLATIRSSKYMIVGRVVNPDGTSSVYKIARDGNKYAAYLTSSGKEIGLIMGAQSVYMITTEDKSYIEIPKDLIEENAPEEDLQAILSGEAYDVKKEVVDSHKKTIDGVKYTLVRYDDGTVDYLNGTVLVKTVAADGSVLYYDTVTPDVPAGIFFPPSDYTSKEFNYENVSEVVGDMVPSTDEHEGHSHEQ